LACDVAELAQCGIHGWVIGLSLGGVLEEATRVHLIAISADFLFRVRGLARLLLHGDASASTDAKDTLMFKTKIGFELVLVWLVAGELAVSSCIANELQRCSCATTNSSR
jgi:hypothetical protein